MSPVATGPAPSPSRESEATVCIGAAVAQPAGRASGPTSNTLITDGAEESGPMHLAKAQTHGGDRRTDQSATLHFEAVKGRAAESGPATLPDHLATVAQRAAESGHLSAPGDGADRTSPPRLISVTQLNAPNRTTGSVTLAALPERYPGVPWRCMASRTGHARSRVHHPHGAVTGTQRSVNSRGTGIGAGLIALSCVRRCITW